MRAFQIKKDLLDFHFGLGRLTYLPSLCLTNTSLCHRGHSHGWWGQRGGEGVMKMPSSDWDSSWGDAGPLSPATGQGVGGQVSAPKIPQLPTA